MTKNTPKKIIQGKEYVDMTDRPLNISIPRRNYIIGLFYLLKNYKRKYGSIFKHIKSYNRWQRELKNINKEQRL